MSDEDRPHLRIVAGTGEPSPARDEYRKRVAERALRDPLLQLAANVLRIVRGAGKPYTLYRDCHRVIDAFNDYHDEFGQLPPLDLIADELRLQIETQGADILNKRDWAFETIARGSLQLAAATLLDQKMQIASGEQEMINGMRQHTEYIEEEQAKWAATHRQMQKRRPRLSRKAKKDRDIRP